MNVVSPKTPAEWMLIREIDNLKRMSTELLKQYNELFDMTPEQLVQWQAEARRRRGMGESTTVQ